MTIGPGPTTLPAVDLTSPASLAAEQKLDELVRFVRAAGRIPVQRDTLYNEIRRWDAG